MIDVTDEELYEYILKSDNSTKELIIRSMEIGKQLRMNPNSLFAVIDAINDCRKDLISKKKLVNEIV